MHYMHPQKDEKKIIDMHAYMRYVFNSFKGNLVRLWILTVTTNNGYYLIDS